MDELDQALADLGKARAEHIKALQALTEAATSLAATVRKQYGTHETK